MFLARRAAAEGIKTSAVMAALTTMSDRAKTGGWMTELEMSNYPARNSCDLALEIAASAAYGGGYLHSGDFWRLDGHGSLGALHARHFLNEHDRRAYHASPVEQLLNAAPVGAKATLKADFGDASYSEVWTKKGRAWELSGCWSARDARHEEQLPVLLYSGVREDTATFMGVEMTATFNEVFDLCI